MRGVVARIAFPLFLSCLLLLAPPGSAIASAKDKPSPAGGSKSYAHPAEVPGATPIGAEECETCHDAVAPVFGRTPHGQRNVACEDCHGPGSLHAADSQGHGHIHAFAKESAEEANAICLNCHADQTALHAWDTGRHRAEGVRCIDCHDVHADPLQAKSASAAAGACVRCHKEQEAQGGLPYHHPVREGRMGCADCHEPHGGTAGDLRASRVNDLCFKCHGEYEGPFAYQHPPVTESCLKCHTAHGSMNAHLLQVSEPMLCLQCHAGHHNGSMVSLLNACTNCHSSIHGTDTQSATGGSVFIDK